MRNSPLDFRNPRLLLAEESKDELIDEILKPRDEKKKLEQQLELEMFRPLRPGSGQATNDHDYRQKHPKL